MYWGNDDCYISVNSLWRYFFFVYFYLAIVYHNYLQVHFSVSLRHVQLELQLFIYVNLRIHIGTEPLLER